MIEEIRIENLGVIGSARVPLGRGLTAITGETGAGKTMLLTGLSLLLGGRADASIVRSGSTQATAEGVFLTEPGSAVAERVREAGGEVDDDGSVVVARSVAAAGRSRAHLGGRSVPQALLVELAEELVTVHGQADQLRLRSPRRQREAVDVFAGAEHGQTLVAYRAAWAERQRVTGEVNELVAHAAEREREAEQLRAGLAEVERVDPQPGEDAELGAQAERLTHSEDLRIASLAAHTALSGTEGESGADGAAGLVEHARRTLDQVAQHDEALGDLAGRLAEVGYLLGDLSLDVARYLDGVQADPARLQAVQERRADLVSLTRSHSGTIDDVLAWASQAGLRLLELDDGDERVEALRARVQELDGQLGDLAGQVSAGRRDAAARLSTAVTAELAGLAMPNARFDVELAPAADFGPWGAEEVEMLLVAHAGAPRLPLGQGASGGELARVMLAIEVTLATASDTYRPTTLVFDEVDAGVGGKAAVEVGRRLAELARQAQVVVVTHLPQVAAFADHHVVVTKSHAGGADVVTASDVQVVTGPGRVAELARMLSGHEDSPTARVHAVELLQRSTVGR